MRPLDSAIVSLRLLYWPTKVIINWKKTALTCTVMMMVMMISSAIMWMLHILSLSSHQRQTKWNKEKLEQKSTSSLDRFINPIKMINSMGGWLTIDVYIYIYILNGVLTTSTVKQWQSMPFTMNDNFFSSFWRYCGWFFVQIHKTKRHEIMMCYMSLAPLCDSKMEEIKRVFFVLPPIMTKSAVNERWRANGCVCRCQFGIAKKWPHRFTIHIC